MAEVRQIPSAVGAYEAQVISFDKAYRAIVSQEQARQKQKAALAEDTQKFIERSLVDDRQFRPQDEKYIAKLKEDVNNFYYENRNSILSGGSALGELKQRMGKLKSEIGYSNSLFRQAQSLAPIAKEAMSPTNDIDPVALRRWEAFNLPINDPNRKKEFPDIDETSPVHLTYSKALNEKTDIDDKFSPLQMTISKEQLGNTKYGLQDQVTEIKMVKPADIQAVVFGAASDKPISFKNTYGKRLEMYKKVVPEEQKTLDFNDMVEAYKDITGVNVSGMFNEGGAGIDTEYEYALYSKLYNNLPYEAKFSYSYKTKNMLMNQEQLALNRSRQFLGNKAKDKTDLPETLFNMLKPGNFSKESFTSWFDNTFGVGDMRFGNVKPATLTNVTVDANGIATLDIETQAPLRDPTNNELVKDEAQAKVLASKGGGQVVLAKADMGGGKFMYFAKRKLQYKVNTKKREDLSLIQNRIIAPILSSMPASFMTGELGKETRLLNPQEQTILPGQREGYTGQQ